MKSGEGEGKGKDCMSKKIGAGENSPEYVQRLLTKRRNFVLPKQLSITEAFWKTHPQSLAASHPDQPAARLRRHLLTGRSPERSLAARIRSQQPSTLTPRRPAPRLPWGCRAPSASGLDRGFSLWSGARRARASCPGFCCPNRGREAPLRCRSAGLLTPPLRPGALSRSFHPGPAHPTPLAPTRALCQWLRPPGCCTTQIPEAGSGRG